MVSPATGTRAAQPELRRAARCGRRAEKGRERGARLLCGLHPGDAGSADCLVLPQRLGCQPVLPQLGRQHVRVLRCLGKALPCQPRGLHRVEPMGPPMNADRCDSVRGCTSANADCSSRGARFPHVVFPQCGAGFPHVVFPQCGAGLAPLQEDGGALRCRSRQGVAVQTSMLDSGTARHRTTTAMRDASGAAQRRAQRAGRRGGTCSGRHGVRRVPRQREAPLTPAPCTASSVDSLHSSPDPPRKLLSAVPMKQMGRTVRLVEGRGTRSTAEGHADVGEVQSRQLPCSFDQGHIRPRATGQLSCEAGSSRSPSRRLSEAIGMVQGCRGPRCGRPSG